MPRRPSPSAATGEISPHAIRKLRLNQLQLVHTIVASGSFADAAQQLGLTQSAVTKAVQELERFFDGHLFVRTNRGVQATELALALDGHARSILAEARFMADSVNALRAADAGRLCVGVLTTATSRVLSDAVRAMRRDHPGVELTVLVGDRNQLHAYLVEGKVDLVFGSLPRPNAAHLSRLAVHPLYEDELVVVAAPAHPLAGRRRVMLAQVLACPCIVPPVETVVRQRVEQLIRDAGLAWPADRIESLAPLLNIGLLADGRTVAFMAGGLAHLLQATAAVVRLPLRLPASYGAVGYVVRAERQPTSACAVFIEELRRQAERPV